MNFLNLIKIAIKAIASNKFRSFLSMLGIIIGVAAVIIMMAIGQGSKESVRKNISQMGTNIIMIRPGADMRGGVRQDPSAMQTLKVADYEKINAEKNYISHVSPEVSASGQAIFGAKNTLTSLYGETPEVLDIRQWRCEEERQSMLGRQDRGERTLWRRTRPGGARHPIQEHTAAHYRSIEIERLQRFRNGSRQLDDCSLHHRDEKSFGADLSFLHQLLCSDRGNDRQRH